MIIILLIAAGCGLVLLITFILCQISAYRYYKKNTLNHNYQRMNYDTFISTYQLFSERYSYYRNDGDLYYLTYEIVSQGIHPFFPNKTEYYILFNFKDWFRVDNFLCKKEAEKENRLISDRETNAVLEDLHRLCKKEIEKADQEVSEALTEMRYSVEKMKESVQHNNEYDYWVVYLPESGMYLRKKGALVSSPEFSDLSSPYFTKDVNKARRFYNLEDVRKYIELGCVVLKTSTK